MAYQREHVGLGPFPPVAERFERLEEAIQICRQMGSGEAKPYEGRHYRLAESLARHRSSSACSNHRWVPLRAVAARPR